MEWHAQTLLQGNGRTVEAVREQRSRSMQGANRLARLEPAHAHIGGTPRLAWPSLLISSQPVERINDALFSNPAIDIRALSRSVPDGRLLSQR
ncbi:hypothetical protein [Azohydromonas lata]|uniref:hypothetical protein n=1 Tax=Azohydromonas lata TaxID=45677 RepID=UPI0012F4ECFF|nr:hypothetical protein [Azohydromonas lata]